jgi:hypothetical protein
MPRFFFHVLDGSVFKDEDGEELPSAESARAHAARIAKELAQAGEYGGFAVKVLDEQGNEVAYVPIGKRSNWNRHLHLRRGTKFLHHSLAQALGIALAGFCKIYDLACDHFVGQVAAISKPKRYQSHFKSNSHDPDRFRIEFLAI